MPLSLKRLSTRIAAMPMAGMAGMKNTTLTSAPVTGEPLASASRTRKVLFPLRGGLGSVLKSIVVCWVLAAPAPPASGGVKERNAA